MRVEKDLTIDGDRGAAGDLEANDLPLGERPTAEGADGESPGSAADAGRGGAQSRDFVCMYIGEGYRRSPNAVALCNSSPNVIVLGDFWIRRFARNPVVYSLQYHADQDVSLLQRTRGDTLDIDPDCIRLQRKSNSNQMRKRTWRSRWGVLTVAASDTYFRARLQAWMDRTIDGWLHSIDDGV